MGRGTGFAVAAAAAATLVVGGPAQAQGQQVPEILIELTNYARIPATIVDDAKGEVDRVFRAAGVHVVWRDKKRPARGCTHDHVARRCVAVDLLNDRRAESDGVRSAGEEVLGLAAPGRGRAFVFFNRLTRASLNQTAHVDVVLAQVIAHEVGHLLLPSNSHSPLGIMRPRVDFAHTAFRQFTVDQSELIRNALTGYQSNR